MQPQICLSPALTAALSAWRPSHRSTTHTGLRGHVDDVVLTRHSARPRIARNLLDAITLLARLRQLRTLDLSSRPSRAVAIGLYEAVGFQRRDSTADAAFALSQS